jgi:UDP-N-acetylglucosamine--N-acetylmuramyl-(pentapeptide) pyrophosphoryl-undecaprenol N-acetylglucosamine transferase
MNTAPLLCIAGGGTGGHVMPALALAEAARRRWSMLQVQFIGAERGLEATMLPARGEHVLLLPMHSVQGAGIGQRLRVLLWELPMAILKVRRHWRGAKPNLVVGVGGYASVTGVLAALLSRIPVVLYEQNAVPGLVNRALARLSRRIMLGFNDAAARLPATKTVATGNIVASALHGVRWQAHTPPRILVMGGSQGAEWFNRLVPEACGILAGRGISFRVTHAAGKAPGRIDQVKRRYAEAGVEAEVMGFCEDMPGFYAGGDLMIARAGAMSVSEAAMCGMPAVFVPLPHAADNHQLFNARALADHDAALIADQASTDAASLADMLTPLLSDAGRLAAMSEAARNQAPIDAETRQLAVLEAFLPGVEA